MGEPMTRPAASIEASDEYYWSTSLELAEGAGERSFVRSTAAEMFFFRAPLAHVAQYQELLAVQGRRCAEEANIDMARRRRSLVVQLEEAHEPLVAGYKAKHSGGVVS